MSRTTGQGVQDLLAIAILAVAALALAGSPAGAAEDGAPAKPAPAAVATSSAPAPTYQLPKVGKPRGRIGGGRRGPLLAGAEIEALVPDHVGQTLRAQPEFFWYLAEPTPGGVAFEVTLVDDTSVDPLVDRRIATPAQVGLQRISLADLGVSLDPGREYQWSVAVVPDPGDHAKDLVATGWVQRVDAPPGLDGRIAAAGPDGEAAIYGEAGLWYDMLAAAFGRLDAHPDDEAYREGVARVLEQAGLPAAAVRRSAGTQ